MTRQRYQFGVITEVPGPKGPKAWENLALSNVSHVQIGSTPDTCQPLNGGKGAAAVVDRQVAMLVLALRAPVFELGEVLVLGLDGRELTGRLRKPHKWGVRCELFDDADEAIARACEVAR